MPAKKKIKKGFYFRGHGNFATIYEYEIYYWDGKNLDQLVIIDGRDIWLNCNAHWGKDFNDGIVSIGDDKQFTYLGE